MGGELRWNGKLLQWGNPLLWGELGNTLQYGEVGKFSGEVGYPSYPYYEEYPYYVDDSLFDYSLYYGEWWVLLFLLHYWCWYLHPNRFILLLNPIHVDFFLCGGFSSPRMGLGFLGGRWGLSSSIILGMSWTLIFIRWGMWKRTGITIRYITCELLSIKNRWKKFSDGESPTDTN